MKTSEMVVVFATITTLFTSSSCQCTRGTLEVALRTQVMERCEFVDAPAAEVIDFIITTAGRSGVVTSAISKYYLQYPGGVPPGAYEVPCAAPMLRVEGGGFVDVGRVTVRLQAVSLYAALQAVCRAASLRFEIQGERVLFFPTSGAMDLLAP